METIHTECVRCWGIEEVELLMTANLDEIPEMFRHRLKPYLGKNLCLHCRTQILVEGDFFIWRGCPVFWWRTGTYQEKGRLFISGHNKDGELLLKVTTNLPQEPLEEDEIFVKTWSENEGLLPLLVKHALVEDTGVYVPTGHVIAPKVKLTEYFKRLLELE